MEFLRRNEISSTARQLGFRNVNPHRDVTTSGRLRTAERSSVYMTVINCSFVRLTLISFLSSIIHQVDTYIISHIECCICSRTTNKRRCPNLNKGNAGDWEYVITCLNVLRLAYHLDSFLGGINPGMKISCLIF